MKFLIASVLICLSNQIQAFTAGVNPVDYPPAQNEEWRLIQLRNQELVWIPLCALDSHVEQSCDVDDNLNLIQSLRTVQPFGPGYIDVTADYWAYRERAASSEYSEEQLQLSEKHALFFNQNVAEFVTDRDDVALYAPLSKVMSFPTTASQMTVVEPLIKQLKSENLYKFIDSIVKKFPDRKHNGKYGPSVSQWVSEQFQQAADEGKLAADAYSIELFTGKSSKQPSVIVTLFGETDSRTEIVVLGSHLDSTAGFSFKKLMPGADDDASGVACVLEIFRVLSLNGFKPKRTIQFMAYAAEEAGLLGSKDVARHYRDENADVKGMLQMEMSGYKPKGTNGFVTVMKDSDEVMGAYVHMIASQYLLKVTPTSGQVGVRYSVCGYGCSDHYSWTAVKYPAVAIAEAGPSDRDLNPNIHTVSDTLDALDMEYLLNFARVGLAFAVELASA